MRALRSIRRFGAGLGLLALLLQSTLSFAHVHPDDLLGVPAALIADAIAGNALADQDRHTPGAPHDHCPICTAMHLAGTIVVPDPPALAVPTEFIHVSFAAKDFVATVIPRRLPFQTRAPPSA
jgi:hypothetical protein